MSIFGEIITSFTLSFFGLNQNFNKGKIVPKIEFVDLELGEVISNSLTNKTKEIHMMEKYVDCEFKSIIEYPDLELGFGPIVEIDRENIFIDMNAFEKSKIYDNYASFMESVSYLATPFKDRCPVFFKDLYPSWKTKALNNEFHVVLHIQTSSIGLKYVCS